MSGRDRKKTGTELTAKARAYPRNAIPRREFLRRIGGVTLGATFAGVGGLVYSRDLETAWIEVTSVGLSLPRHPSDLAGYRIVHVSDLHLDDHTEPDHAENLVRRINEQRPDLIAFTGDFVTYAPERFVSRLTGILSGLEARDGMVAVLGNHDHLTDPEVVVSAIREAGAVVLRNEVLSLRRAGPLHVCGLDDVWEGDPRLDLVLDRLPRDGVAVLLVHEPDYADASAATGRFDLQLSGHSHGGQVRLPLLGATVLPRYARKYPMGAYRIEDMLLYTNRGLGMLPPRYRFLCRPEVTVLDLNPRRDRAGTPDPAWSV